MVMLWENDDEAEAVDDDDEWRMILGGGAKKEEATTEGEKAEEAAGAEAEAEVDAEAEAAADEAVAEAVAEEAAGEEATAEAAAPEAPKHAPLFGDFEISDEEAEEDGEAEAAEDAAAADEQAAEEAGAEFRDALDTLSEANPAGPAVAKAPVAKRPAVSKYAPVAKRPPAAGQVRPAIAKRPPMQAGRVAVRPQVRPQAAGGVPAGVAAMLAGKGKAKGKGKGKGSAPEPTVTVAVTSSKGNAKGKGGSVTLPSAALAGGRPPQRPAAAPGASPRSSVVAAAAAAANAAMAARAAAAGKSPGPKAGGAKADGDATPTKGKGKSKGAGGGGEANAALEEKAQAMAEKALASLSDEAKAEKIPKVKKAILARLLLKQKSGGAEKAATGTGAATNKAALMAKLRSSLKGRGKGAGADAAKGPELKRKASQEDAWEKPKKKGSFEGGELKRRNSMEGTELKRRNSREGVGGKLERQNSNSWEGVGGKLERQNSNSWEAPAKKSKGGEEPKISATDPEGRKYDFKHVVVNFANVGATFSKKVMGKKDGDKLFDWEGVRRCVRFLKSDKKLKVIGVIHENFRGFDNQAYPQVTMPNDISSMCETIEETPRLTGKCHSSADDEMTIKCAYRRNCRFLDNDNYRDWLQQMRDPKIRTWLVTCQDLLQMRYYFDKGLGSFDTLEGNVPAYLLAEGKDVDKRALWTASRG